MINIINAIKISILKNKGLIVVILLALSLLIPSIFIPSRIEATKKSGVLKIVSNSKLQISTPTSTITPSPIPTVTPTPTPAGLEVQVGIDYAGQKASDSYSTIVSQGQSAWDAVVAAVGMDHLQYTNDPDMGIFITGFNGINAGSSHYFEFKVNSISSNVGVSSYKCNNGDKLDFVLTSF